MIIDMPAIHMPAAVGGPEIVEQVRSNRRSRERREARRARMVAPAFVVGMILLMDDGTQCRVVSVEPNGIDGTCVPVTE